PPPSPLPQVPYTRTADHRHPHSFPTRRSSDLMITHHVNLAARFADQVLILAEGRAVARGAPAGVLTRETVERVFSWPVAIEENTDRKSTRLNSSHVAISYAVFCLKKRSTRRVC